MQVRLRAWRMQLSGLTPTTRGILWALAAGFLFQLGNASGRALSLEVPPLEAQFLRYLTGTLMMLPMVLHAASVRHLMPHSMTGQLWRNALHTAGLVLWYLALPHLALADMTAIGFTNPLFVLIGASLFLKEPMNVARWVAVLAGFGGMLVIIGPAVSGSGGWYNLLMLASAPVFAASFLLTKVLTRRDSPMVIVLWQSLLVTLMSLPLAVPGWVWPNLWQWVLAVIGGLVGTVGHYCLTRSFVSVDISATQSVKFVDLLWAALIGWVAFGDPLRATTVLGGAVIIASIVALERHERRQALVARPG